MQLSEIADLCLVRTVTVAVVFSVILYTLITALGCWSSSGGGVASSSNLGGGGNGREESVTLIRQSWLRIQATFESFQLKLRSCNHKTPGHERFRSSRSVLLCLCFFVGFIVLLVESAICLSVTSRWNGKPAMLEAGHCYGAFVKRQCLAHAQGSESNAHMRCSCPACPISACWISQWPHQHITDTIKELKVTLSFSWLTKTYNIQAQHKALEFRTAQTLWFVGSKVKKVIPNRCTADKVVKVPEMAESITEGTLKQYSKRGSSERLLDRMKKRFCKH